MEGFRCRNGVLTSHGIHHQQDLVGLNGLLDLFQLVHQGFVHVETACRIHDEHIQPLALRLFFGAQRDVGRIFAGPVTEHGNVHLAADDFQLVDGCRPLHVAGCQHRVLALLLQVRSQLGAGRGLTGALQTHHQDGRKTAGRIRELAAAAAHEGDQFVVYDLDGLLTRRMAL